MGYDKYYYFDIANMKRIRKIPVVEIKYGTSLKGKKRCNAIYIPYENKDKSIKFLDEIKNLPILTIGERGGGWYDTIISIYSVRNRISFSVDIEKLKLSKLSIDLKFLELGQVIH